MSAHCNVIMQHDRGDYVIFSARFLSDYKSIVQLIGVNRDYGVPFNLLPISCIIMTQFPYAQVSCAAQFQVFLNRGPSGRDTNSKQRSWKDGDGQERKGQYGGKF